MNSRLLRLGPTGGALAERLRRPWWAARAGLLLALLPLANVALLQAVGAVLPGVPLAAVPALLLQALCDLALLLLACLSFWIVWHADAARPPPRLRVLAACLLGMAALLVLQLLAWVLAEAWPALRALAAGGAWPLAARLMLALGLLAAAGPPGLWAGPSRASLPAPVLRAALLLAALGLALWLALALAPLAPARQGPWQAGLMLLCLLAAALAHHGRRQAPAMGSAHLFAAAALTGLAAACAALGAGQPGGGAWALLEPLYALGAMLLLYRGVLQQTLRQSMQTLRRSEESLRSLVACAPDAIVVTDEQGRIQQANPRVQALLGYTPQELLGRPLTLLMGGADARHHDAYMASYATGRRGMTADGREVLARRKDGSLVSVHVRVGEMPLRGGRGFVGFLRDMSERQQAEAERLRLQRQLLQAQKMQALGQFTGGIAHDFNNMLTGILGLSALALERHVDEPEGKLATYLREINQVGERGRELIARLMSFAHPERRRPPVLRPLEPVVEEVLRMLRPALPGRIELGLQCEPGLPPVWHVEGDVHQMLSNLVLNAGDAISGPGRVQVRLERLQAGAAECASCGHRVLGDQLALSVQDDGQGIAPELLARVFDPFFTTKDVGKGTGLGLAGVHSLVHQAGGHVLLHSVPGAGSCFRLLLPVPAQPPEANAGPAGEPPP